MSDNYPQGVCHGLLALELDAGSSPRVAQLERDAAADLAGLIAVDLARLLPAAETLDLAILGAVYDQAQLLRPDWPLYTELDAHYRRANRGAAASGAIFALGAAAGRMPDPLLEPEPGLAGGTMLLLPWLLIGERDVARAIGARMEQDFVARGEAGRATADWLMRTIGVGLQHARYLTRDDLCALSSVQLEHAGFGALWQLLEVALFTPQRTEQVRSGSGLVFDYADRAVTLDAPGYAGWARSEAAAYLRTPQDLARGFAGALLELRQSAALLHAHGVPLRLRAAAGETIGAGYWIEILATALPGEICEIFAHDLHGLGILALSVATLRHGAVQVLANAYPIDAAALPHVLQALRDTYSVRGEPQRLGDLVIDAQHRTLSVPLARLIAH